MPPTGPGGLPPAPPSRPRRPWWRSRAGIATIAIAVLIALAAIGGTQKQSPTSGQASPTVPVAAVTPSGAATPTPNATATAKVSTTSTVTPGPSEEITPEPTEEVTPEPTPDLAFSPITKKGHGNKVVRFTIPTDVGAIAQITEKGSSNFVVWAVDPSGAKTDLLVNVIGNYSGTVLFDEEEGVHTVAFAVESNGSWTFVIKPVELARTWTGGSTIKGKGDAVLLLLADVSGLETLKATHTGRENFVIWAWATDGRDLLVNEIGRFSGEELLPSGTILLAITADGAWTLTIK